MGKVKSFLVQCKRVWSVLKKPTRQEFELTAKVAGAGIGLLGLFGFIVALFMKFVKPLM